VVALGSDEGREIINENGHPCLFAPGALDREPLGFAVAHHGDKNNQAAWISQDVLLPL
jgi:hypothetical protein